MNVDSPVTEIVAKKCLARQILRKLTREELEVLADIAGLWLHPTRTDNEYIEVLLIKLMH